MKSFIRSLVALTFLVQLLLAQSAVAQLGVLAAKAKEKAEAALIAKAKKEFYERLGHAVGDELPVKLDAPHQAFAHIQPPTDFYPRRIACTPQTMNTRLPPGDYTCEVRLYCQRDSEHRPGTGIAYEFAQYQGPQAAALETLVFRGTVRNIPPETLQLVSWQLQDGIAVNQLPPQQQTLVRELIPESAQSLNSNPVTKLHDWYDRVPFLHDFKTFDQLISEGGEPGRIFQKLERSQTVLKKNALNYERADQEVYDGPPADRTLRPASPEVSPWSEVRPGVVGQLTIENGNLGLNKFSFRVLPKANTHSALNRPHLVYASYGQFDLSLSDYLTIAEIFGSALQPEFAPELLADAAKRQLGRALIGYAMHYGAQAMLMMMAQNGEGESSNSGSSKESKKDKGTDPESGDDPNGPNSPKTWPLVIGGKQLGTKLREHAKDFGLNPADAADREAFTDMVKDIGEHPDQVRNGTFAGQGGTAQEPGARGPVQFRIKGTTVVVTKPDGTFVTILKDGTGSTSVQRGVPIYP